MKLQIIPFKARHIPLIKPDATPEIIELGKMAEASGCAITGCVMGDPIGAAGVAEHYGGMGQAWTLFSPYIKARYRITIIRQARRLISEAFEEGKYSRIVALVDPDDPKACDFVEDLGFKLSRFMYELGADKWHS